MYHQAVNLYTALQAGFDASKIYFHGNNKSEDELDLAIKHGSNIIIDNDYELNLIKRISKEKYSDKQCNVMLRLKPEIDAHTHDYIKTGQLDSKFGIERQDVLALAKDINTHENLTFLGIHSHIGSQTFDTTPYNELINIFTRYCIKFKKT